MKIDNVFLKFSGRDGVARVAPLRHVLEAGFPVDTETNEPFPLTDDTLYDPELKPLETLTPDLGEQIEKSLAEAEHKLTEKTAELEAAQSAMDNLARKLTAEEEKVAAAIKELAEARTEIEKLKAAKPAAKRTRKPKATEDADESKDDSGS